MKKSKNKFMRLLKKCHALDEQSSFEFFDMNGQKISAILSSYIVGSILMRLETNRALLGHTNLNSALIYVHGSITKLPEFQFVEALIKNEKIRRKDDTSKL